ncbi:autotransporter domain-containing protein [Stenotrophomonas nitritireducens]|uniref:autotransporter domain-containing protein n=1 Tax=Stenotrophomonas nitritireducens TaxID=83617 RepID=UPI003D951761
MALLLCVPQLAHAVPTDIQLSNQSVGVGGGLNATVGTFSTSDAGVGETFTYTLVAGTGDTDNPAFQISGNSLLANNPSTFTPGTQKSVRVRSTNSQNATYEKAFTLSVMPANLVISAGAASAPRVGDSYSQSNVATGGVAPYTYALNAGAFVPGTSLDASTGLVSGTPTVAGSFAYQLWVTDSQAPSAMAVGAIVSVTIAKGNQTVSFMPSLPGVAQVGGAPYSVSAVASSGLTPTVSLAAGSSGCVLAGGTLTFTAVGTCVINANQAGDSNWNAAAQAQHSINIGAAGGIAAAVDFAPGSIGVGAAGQVTITFTNPNASSSPAFSVLLTSPALVSRIPAMPGGSCTVGAASVPSMNTVQLTNVVVPAGSCTVTFGYNGATAGSAAGFALDAFTPSGYPTTQPTVGNSIVVVPTVITLSPNAGPVSQVVTVSGTGFSTTPGNNLVSFGGAGNGTVTAASATSLTVTAPAAGSGPVAVTVAVNGQTSTSNATYTFIDKPVAADTTGVTVPYNSTGTAIDLSGAITGTHHSIAIGSAAAHGTTSVAGDVVTYTPTAGYFGTDSFTYTATGTGGTSNVATVSLTVATPAAPVAADRAVLVPYQSPGTPIDLASSITGVHAAIAIATAPQHGTASIAGDVVSYVPVPGYSGPDTFTYVATGPGGTSAPARVSLTVSVPPLELGPTSLAAATASNAYTQRVTAKGGTAPYTYAASALPAGLVLSAEGELSGVPTGAGSFGFDITATDSSTGAGPFSVTRHYTLVVATPSLQLDPALPPATGDVGYQQQLGASGGTSPYRFSLSSGALPPGLTLLESGRIEGEPSAAGSYDFSVQVTDANGFTGVQAYHFQVQAGAQVISAFVATPAEPVYVQGGSFTLGANGGGSGNPVSFASSTPAVCTVSGATVTMLAAGTCGLTADQAGNAMYQAATQVRLDVNIAVGTPQLSWLGDLTRTQGEDAFELPVPHSSSPGAFSYASSNPAVATISGRTVTLVGEGTTVLMATQAATGNFATVTVQLQLTVSARPDPTHDGQVSAGLQAQVDASVRFAQVQGDNIRARLRQVRSGTNASNFNFALAYAGSQQASGLTLPVGQAALPALPQGWGLWLAGTATFGKVGRNGGAGGGFDFDTGGITLGADRAVGENLLFGMAGSWGRQDTDFDGSPSKVDADQRSLAAYGLWRLGEHLFVDGLLANGRLDFDLTRWSEPAHASAQASRRGDQWFGSLTVGYEHRNASGMSVTGYGRYDGHRATLDGYREHGLGIYDLGYGRQRVDNSALAVGLEGSLSFKRERLNWRPYWSIEYRSALENRGDVAMNYVQRPQGTDYVLAMRSYNDDMLALGAGMDLQLDSGWMFSLLFGHEQGRNAMRSNSIGLQVRFGQQGAHVPMFGEGDELGVGDDTRRRCRGGATPCAAPAGTGGDRLP